MEIFNSHYMEYMKDKFIKVLEVLYNLYPSEVLTILTGNKTYLQAGDEKTKDTFPVLEKLYRSPFEKRKSNWYKNRHKILKKLREKEYVDDETLLFFY